MATTSSSSYRARPTWLAGRTVVYLDQNHWSTIAAAHARPETVRNESELEAALTLTALVEDRQVILPISSGHMLETTKWTHDKHRAELGLAIAQLSRGWQMRDPLDVRRCELTAGLAELYREVRSPPPAVFTLEPDAIHASVDEIRPLARDPELTPHFALAASSLTHISVLWELLLGQESIPAGPYDRWAEALQRQSNWLAAEPPTERRLLRARTRTLFIADLGHELAHASHAAGITPEDMGRWTLEDSELHLRSLPFLGLLREAFHDKFADPRTQWKQNTLIDPFNLGCAAGYADHVVGERNLIGKLRQGARRLGRDINVHRRLADVVNAVA